MFEPTINIAMKDINAKFYPETNDTTEVQKQLDDVIAEYNSVVDEYNLLLQQHPEITQYTQISNDNSYTVTDVSLAKNAISSYSQRISEIKDRISDINDKIQQGLTSQDYSIYEQEYYDAVLEDEASLSDDMNKLVHDCSVLDGLLHELTIPTTEAERAVVDDVQTALYNAMISLNTVLINPDLNTTDVHQECLLMMSAAEQLKSIGSSFKYPALSMFV